VRLEKLMWGSWTPAKVKMGVSGCPRNCAEATCKDVGVVCVDSGYEIHVGGAAGLHLQKTEVLTKAATEQEAIWAICAVTQLYREQAWYGERIYKWMGRVGLESLRDQIEDPERRRALYDRFAYSQRFARIDPWAERVAGRDAQEFNPLTRRMEFVPA
jgi:nitrite reductase (NADH) large subunit